MSHDYWVQLDIARMRDDLEAAKGRPMVYAEWAAWLAESGLAIAPHGGYFADETALARLRPGDVIEKRLIESPDGNSHAY